ncbi:MAG: FHA domain-containing protein [Deltaproteobacteria bacterium]|nr:FHA domain-containing protein [Deltaproteobacteria bacterium]MCB2186353.1 FHA domain-containing protein [Deltaproteobacteria bacterium]
MAKLIFTSADSKGKTLDLEQKEVLVVGRDPSCDLTLDHPDVSRRHAELRRTPQGYLIKDLGSTNGTTVNGTKVAEKLLANGDKVAFGAVTSQVEIPAADKTRVRSTRVHQAAPPRLVDEKGQEVVLDKEVTLVGREKSCDLVLGVESVSARHAELRLTPQGVMLKDLGSTNGTFVNGQKVTEKLLAEGDKLAFDVVKFRFSQPGGPQATRVRGAGAIPVPPGMAEHPAAKAPRSPWGLIAALVVVVALAGAGVWWFQKRQAVPVPVVEPTVAAPPATTAPPEALAPTAAPVAMAPTAALPTAAPMITAPPAAPVAMAPAAGAGSSMAGKGEAKRPRQVIERLVFNHVWSFTTKDKVLSSPTVGDVNGDGVINVVVGSNDAGVYNLDGKDGRRYWSYRTDGPVMSSPLLVDLTKDGLLDVVVGSDDGHVYALNGKGQKIWVAPEDAQTGAGNEFQSSPAASDLNGDGVPDLVVGNKNGKLFALAGDRGWTLWNTGTIMKAGVFATPAMMDVNGDGTADALVGSLDNRFYCIDGKNGWKMWEFPTKGPIKASAALGDLDGDKRPEVVVGSTDGALYALHAADGVELWRYESGQPIESSPELADVNGDGVPDVLAALSQGKLVAINGKNGLRIWEFDMGGAKVLSSPVVYDLNGDGTADAIICDGNRIVHAVNGVTGWELANFTLNGGVVSSPALADVNGDGLLDLIVGAEDNNVVVLTLNVPVPKKTMVWPNYRKNHARTGN